MLRRTLLIAVCVLLHAELIRADERPDKAWSKYLEGSWTYEINDGTKGNAVWTFEADRHSMIGRFKEGDSTGVEIGGWQPDTKIVMVNGYDSKGNYWQLEYKHFTDKGGRGPIRGKTDDGEYSGDFEATIVDKDHWGWTIKGKTPQGDELNLSATYKRVEPEPQPTNADRLKPFECFVGRWKSEADDGEVSEWKFDWGHNKNSIENKIVSKNGAGEIWFSNSGVIVWDAGDRRFVNATVDASGNRVDFLWEKCGENEWKTWLRGSEDTMVVTVIDANTWTIEWGDESRTYKRQD